MSLTAGATDHIRLDNKASIVQSGGELRDLLRNLKVVATAFELTEEEANILHPARFIAIQPDEDDAEKLSLKPVRPSS